MLAALTVAVTACGGGGGGGPVGPIPDPEVTTIDILELDRDFGLSGDEVTVTWSISNPGSLSGRPHCRLTNRYQNEEIHDYGLVDCAGSHSEELAFPAGSGYVRFAVETVEKAPPNGVLVEFVTVHRLTQAVGERFGTHSLRNHVNVDAVAVAADGSTILAGLTYGALHGTYLGNGDVFVVKESSAGATMWGDQFGSYDHDVVHDLAVDPVGNAYVVGVLLGELGGGPLAYPEGFIRRYASDGTVTWTRVFGGERGNRVMGVAALPDGSAVVVGSTTKVEADGTESEVVNYLKFSSAGDRLWSHELRWDDGTEGVGVSVAFDSIGNLYVGGFYVLPPSTDVHNFLVKLDPDGAPIWTSYLLGTGSDALSASVAVDAADDVLYAVDLLNSHPENPDAYYYESTIHKISSGGSQLWSRQVANYSRDTSRFVPTVLGFGPEGELLFSSVAEVGGEGVPTIGGLGGDGQLAWIVHASSRHEGYVLRILDVAYAPGGSFVLAGLADVLGGTPEPVEGRGFVWRLTR